ncbi:MAG TPA: IS66 family transposase [Niastella sp.]
MSAGIDYKALYEQSQSLNASLQLQVLQLTQQLAQLQKMIFGSRQERFIPADPRHPQLSLDMSTEAVAAGTVTATQQISYSRRTVVVDTKPLPHPGRMKLPESLRREEILIEPTDDTAGCKKIGEEITEVLEYQPGELYVKQYRRPKYAKPDNSGVKIGQLPSRPIEKAMAGEGLLAQVIIDKYIDHLPLHRQMQRFERAGVKLAYSTLTDWVSGTCTLITPLFEALKAEVLQSNYLHADETPIKVMDKDKKGETHRGYYWVYQDSIDKMVLFDYREGRSREGPQQILQGFKGYLQTDGYVAYDVFAKKQDITLIHCMAHARRMFSDALENDEARASHALQEIQKLYTIERICKERQLNFAEKKEVRGLKAAGILRDLGLWLQQQYVQVLPQSAIGKAIAYSLQRWERLSAYVNDGKLNIDNNPVENSIRPVALGRKNYLFAGSHEAAKRSGMLYSLLGTCKMHHIEPYNWLKDVLHCIADHPVNRVQQLLPHRYKK